MNEKEVRSSCGIRWPPPTRTVEAAIEAFDDYSADSGFRAAADHPPPLITAMALFPTILLIVMLRDLGPLPE